MHWGLRMLRWRRAATLTTLLIVMLVPCPGVSAGSDSTSRRNAVLREVLSLWQKGGAQHPHGDRSPVVRAHNPQVRSAVQNIVGGLRTLGLLPSGSFQTLGKSLDRQRLSGFLYNISMYLQGVGEADSSPQSTEQEQFWESVLYSLLQFNGEGPNTSWDSRVPPRPSFRLQELFLSLRGSPHWNGLLGLVQTMARLSEHQPHKALLTFVSQNWRTISALLDTALQVLLSGTYGQANAGVQGLVCALKGRDDCGFNTHWLQQLLSFLETRNWKPVVNLHPAVVDGEHPEAAPPFGRLKPFSVLPGALREAGPEVNVTQADATDLGSVHSLLLQALSRSGLGAHLGRPRDHSPALLRGLDGLQRGILHRVGSSVYRNLRRKVSHVTLALLEEVSGVVGAVLPPQQEKCSMGDLRQLILWGIRHNVTWNAQALGFSSQALPSRPHFMTCFSSRENGRFPKPLPPVQTSKSFKPHESGVANVKTKTSELLASIEILEAACNDSIPGITGVSNFTVFLYCNLFEGNSESTSAEPGRSEPDLHTTCSDAAWYLSAAEEDFLWVHVCSEFFAHQFNSTVCANSTFWHQRAHLALLSSDRLDWSSIDDLCMQLSSSMPGAVAPDADEECLTRLSTRSLSAKEFRRCFLPDGSTLITALCGNDSMPVPHDAGWAADYCSRNIHNDSVQAAGQDPCSYEHWEAGSFVNRTLLELCAEVPGLREHLCLNATLLRPLVASQPWLLGFCAAAGDEVTNGDGKCFLQRVFDMLPAPYDFDTSRLCASPAPFLLEVLYGLSQCEGGSDGRVGWLGAVHYVLRVLDFVVGLSAGMEEGEREARQGLGQAILLSSLLDNTSFWAVLQPNASLSVLHTIAVFLKREQDPSLKEDLLSCFSPILWDLIQREDNSTALRVLFQEYLQMPRESVRSLLMSAEKEALKRFLSHMHQSWDQLQVETAQASQKEQNVMETMTSAFIHKFSRVTPDLFIDLSQFIPFMSVSDIMTLPASIMANDSVLMAIRDHSSEMKSPQKWAFVKRLLQTKAVDEVPSWPPYFLSSILPLLPYLPVSYFQMLTSQQLSPLVEVLGNSTLDATRGRHVLRTVFSNNKNLSSVDWSRLGTLMCYLNPEEVHQVLSMFPPPQPWWQLLAVCISEGHVSSTGRLSHWLALTVRNLNASDLPARALASLQGLLPGLGASFLQPLTTPQLLDLLTQPGLSVYPPAEAFRILTKLTQDTNLRLDVLCRLRPLLSGVAPSILRALSGPTLGEPIHCQCWSSLLSELHPTQRAIVHSTLLEALERISGNITLQMQCLLPFVPLKTLTLLLSTGDALKSIMQHQDLAWSPQQTQLLYKKIPQTVNMTREVAKSLGRVAGGMSCDWFKLLANESDFLELLRLVSELPGGMTSSLRKCVVQELQKRPGTDLSILPASFSATLPVKMLETLPNTSFVLLLEHVQSHFADFLRLPRHKQVAIAEKAASIMGTTQEGGVSGPVLDFLGPLAPFLDRDTFAQVEWEAFRLRLDDMKGYCVPQDTMSEMGRMLAHTALLGEPSSWGVAQVENAGRLLFALSAQQIGSIPQGALSLDAVEQVLESQRRWEESEAGRSCERQRGRWEKREVLVRGVVKGRGRKRKEPVPSCADIKGTFPSAWRPAQLGRMAEAELRYCVEDVGQDDFLSPKQRQALWARLRPAYSPVKSLSAERILELGCVVTEMSEWELQDVNLADMGVTAHLGSLRGWTSKKARAAAMSFLRYSGLKLQELGVTELASLGNLLCGLSPVEIGRLNAKKLSMASLFLRELALPCTEQQAEALASQLARPQGFGPVSDWGPEVFTEIGTLAVGLDDMTLSALVREQIEGLSPAAIALIPPKKMAVVFSPTQLSWLSMEQASAVTEEQWDELSSEQKRALVLALYEGEVPLDHRGRNHAPPGQSWLCVVMCLVLLCSVL